MKNGSLVIRAVYASIGVAIMILIAKVLAWYITDSPSVLATMTDSFLDIAASFINFIAAKYALQPPDNEHRFGHGKAEDLAVFTQSTFFGLSGFFILVVSAKRLIHPVGIVENEFGIAVMIFSIISTTILILYQTHVYRKTSSNIIRADRLHYTIDLLTNFSVIVSLYLSQRFNSKIIDPIFAIMIALYLIYGAWQLLSRAFHNLLDHEFNQKDKDKLHKLILSNPKVKGYHDLKTRYAGRQAFIQFHMELDGKMSLNESHHISDDIEESIMKTFKGAEVLIHQDPEELNEVKQFSR